MLSLLPLYFPATGQRELSSPEKQHGAGREKRFPALRPAQCGDFLRSMINRPAQNERVREISIRWFCKLLRHSYVYARLELQFALITHSNSPLT